MNLELRKLPKKFLPLLKIYPDMIPQIEIRRDVSTIAPKMLLESEHYLELQRWCLTDKKTETGLFEVCRFNARLWPRYGVGCECEVYGKTADEAFDNLINKGIPDFVKARQKEELELCDQMFSKIREKIKILKQLEEFSKTLS